MEVLFSGIRKPDGNDDVTREFFNGNWNAIDSSIQGITAVLKFILNDGVLDSEAFELSYNGNLSVTMAPGTAVYEGRVLEWSETTLTYTPVSDGTNDIVTICLKWNDELGSAQLVNARGDTEANVAGIKLYVITLTPGMTEITSAAVQDRRQVATLKT